MRFVLRAGVTAMLLIVKGVGRSKIDGSSALMAACPIRATAVSAWASGEGELLLLKVGEALGDRLQCLADVDGDLHRGSAAVGRTTRPRPRKRSRERWPPNTPQGVWKRASAGRRSRPRALRSTGCSSSASKAVFANHLGGR